MRRLIIMLLLVTSCSRNITPEYCPYLDVDSVMVVQNKKPMNGKTAKKIMSSSLIVLIIVIINSTH